MLNLYDKGIKNGRSAVLAQIHCKIVQNKNDCHLRHKVLQIYTSHLTAMKQAKKQRVNSKPTREKKMTL